MEDPRSGLLNACPDTDGGEHPEFSVAANLKRSRHMEFKGGNIVTGLAFGIGAALVAPMLMPVLRPLAKSVIKAGIVAYDQARVSLAELNERTGDMVAEARSEMAQARGTAEERPGSEAAA